MNDYDQAGLADLLALAEATGVSGIGDYVGSDMDYVGAARGGSPKINLGTPQHMQQLLALARKAKAGQLPIIFLGFSTALTASQSGASVASTPNVTIRPTMLTVAPNGDDFEITGMRIGRIDLMAGATAIPAAIFLPAAIRPPVYAPEHEAGTPATLTVNNRTAAASTFRAAFGSLDIGRPQCT